MRAIFNIGLKNNTFSNAEDLLEYLTGMHLVEDVLAFTVVEGEWEGEREQTLVCLLKLTVLPLFLTSWTANLCILLQQDAIALKTKGGGQLVYSPIFTGEDRYAFEEQYFLTNPIMNTLLIE